MHNTGGLCVLKLATFHPPYILIPHSLSEMEAFAWAGGFPNLIEIAKILNDIDTMILAADICITVLLSPADTGTINSNKSDFAAD